MTHRANGWVVDRSTEISHPAIDVSNIRVGGGLIGFVFSAGVFVILLLGVPSLYWFPVGASSVGGIVAVGLGCFHRFRPLPRV